MEEERLDASVQLGTPPCVARAAPCVRVIFGEGFIRVVILTVRARDMYCLSDGKMRGFWRVRERTQDARARAREGGEKGRTGENKTKAKRRKLFGGPRGACARARERKCARSRGLEMKKQKTGGLERKRPRTRPGAADGPRGGCARARVSLPLCVCVFWATTGACTKQTKRRGRGGEEGILRRFD